MHSKNRKTFAITYVKFSTTNNKSQPMIGNTTKPFNIKVRGFNNLSNSSRS